jgi:hypothetical protein
MAKKKISGLPAGSALNGTELVPIVQTGTTKRITTQDIANLGNASGVEGSGTINTLPKFTASSTIGDSKFFDDGTNQGTETTTAVNRFIMSANASIAKIFSFRSANLPRWAFRVDGTESGANAGADLAIRRYNDAGTYIDSPLFIKRSTGNVGIGETNPSFKLDVSSGSVGATSARFKYGIVNNRDFQGYNNGITFQTAGTSNWYIGSSASGSNTEMQIFNSALSAVVLNFSNANGSATFSSGLGIGGATATTSGIQFPATQVASASANNLDDYEEGTWTMGVAFGGGTTGITYTSNTGNYVKIGKQVTVTGYLELSNKGTSVGIAEITGLPFTISNSSANYSAGSVAFFNITFLGTYNSYGRINSTNIYLNQVTTLGALTAITNTNFANNSAIIFSLTYFV